MFKFLFLASSWGYVVIFRGVSSAEHAIWTFYEVGVTKHKDIKYQSEDHRSPSCSATEDTPGQSCILPPSPVLKSPRRSPLKRTAPSQCSLWWPATPPSSRSTSSSLKQLQTFYPVKVLLFLLHFVVPVLVRTISFSLFLYLSLLWDSCPCFSLSFPLLCPFILPDFFLSPWSRASCHSLLFSCPVMLSISSLVPPQKTVEPSNIPQVMVAFQTSEQLSSHYLKLRSIRVWSSDWLIVVLSGCDWFLWTVLMLSLVEGFVR